MKTTIFLGFILLLISESLNAQINKFDYIDSPIRPSREMPGTIFHKKPELPNIKNPDRFRFQDYLAIKSDTQKLYSDLIVAEEFPGSSRYFAKWPKLSSSAYEKSFLVKPDSALKYYLIIKDPDLHPDTK
jgi:hypothetical protein